MKMNEGRIDYKALEQEDDFLARNMTLNGQINMKHNKIVQRNADQFQLVIELISSCETIAL